jgi:HEAT repeat protein
VLASSCGCAGNVNDVLAEARSGEPEAIHEAVIEIGSILERKERAGQPFSKADEQGALYLREVAVKGDDLGRAKAISALSRLSLENLGELFVAGLEDPFWLVRHEAAEALSLQPWPQAALVLSRRLKVEEDASVRVALVAAQASVGGEEALRSLLEVFLDRSGRFRGVKLKAYSAIRKLSGRDYDFADDSSWEALFAERFGESAAPGGSSEVDAPATESPEGADPP